MKAKKINRWGFLTGLFFVIVLLQTVAVAQTELDERAFLEVDDGITIKKADEMLLKLRFRMQNRLGYFSKSDTDLNPESFEARVRRLRLRFDGFLVDPRFQYYLQLSFSRADQNLDGGDIAEIVRDAMVYYFVDDHFYLGFGQGKLPGNRQRVTSSGSLQFADRSIVNSTFNIDRDFGLFAYYTAYQGGRELRVKAAISTGDGRNVPRTNNGLAYTGRLEWLPLGPFIADGDFMEGDLYREPTPKISIGLGGSFNHKAVKEAGQRGTPLFEQRDITTFIADFLMKYNGWALAVEYLNKSVSDPVFDGVPDEFANYVMTGYGINSQLSYLTPGNWELSLRFATVEPRSSIADLRATRDEALFGITRYIQGHRVKAQTHVGFNNFRNIPADMTSPPQRHWVWMFQVEFGI